MAVPRRERHRDAEQQPASTLRSPSTSTLSRHYIDVKLDARRARTPSTRTSVDGDEITLEPPASPCSRRAHAKPTNINRDDLPLLPERQLHADRPGERHLRRGTWQDSGGRVERRLDSGSFTIVAPSASTSPARSRATTIDVVVANGARDGAPVTAPTAVESDDAGNPDRHLPLRRELRRRRVESALGVSSAPVTVTGQQIDLTNIPDRPGRDHTDRDQPEDLPLVERRLVRARHDDLRQHRHDVHRQRWRRRRAQPRTSSPLYIDVTYNATPGATLDYASIFDAGSEFSVTGRARPESPSPGRRPRSASSRIRSGHARLDPDGETAARQQPPRRRRRRPGRRDRRRA